MSKKVPDWVTDPFSDFLDHQKTVSDLVHLSMRGISMLRGLPKAVEVLARVHADDSQRGDSGAQELEHARNLAALAQQEIDRSFPLLHAQAAVSLWTSLESLIRGFLASWLANEPAARDAEAVRKIKIPLAEFQDMPTDERWYYIVDLLDAEVQGPLKQGISRFEASLSVFGLGGAVEDDVRKDLFELCNVRNVLIHRRGVADRRLVKACPWLALKPGDPVAVTHEALGRYMASATRYVITLMTRVWAHFGVDLEAEQDA